MTLLFLCLPTRAQGVFTGFSGGMMLHGGYLFAQTPELLFGQSSLGSVTKVDELRKGSFCYGLGGTLRVHLIDHIHLGAEGFVSNLPLSKTGSNVRTGWGGAMCDYYTQWGKVRPLIGMTIGGGVMKRLFVMDDNTTIIDGNNTLNASFNKTPFFFLDPYTGLEIDLNSHMAMIIRVDYMLPFGKTETTLMNPSGPRLYVGIMFGKLNRN